MHKSLARYDQEWKHVFTYVDYDFRNRKWTTPLIPKSFAVRDVESFCVSAMSHAREALESLLERLDENIQNVERK